jgi:cell division protein ZapA
VSEREPTRVTVKILEKEYTVGCPANERADLLESAEFLDKHMREIRESGKVATSDRIAVLAALNITNELLKLRNKGSIGKEVGTRLKNMRERAESALQRGQQLEL